MSLKNITWLIVISVTVILVVDRLWTNYLSTEMFFKVLLTMFIAVIAGVSISMVKSKPSKSVDKTDDDKKE
ncbi:MAG: hypothetical protein PQ612_05300 [Rickettsiales bacterium]|nr:hypothetical protein [Pseudomonadota bacterium]MDA0966435.1 hypothetical protein [Pseudomonadota bacterium]MDG4543297.1 hypothetical protein [Rickettsiales bacterium]MDG4545563.1 hypothetical protein [Rickettsiales bacterium]MDG4548012.1 hypothetical protein [Rickettsiales bacterium]